MEATLTNRDIGPQDKCVHCSEYKATIRQSQIDRSPLTCGGVDMYGDLTWELPRHKFTWTEKDEAREIERKRFEW